MPRVKHWFPVNHDINGDPEVWELTNTFGDWFLSVWLEILSITDRSEGELIGTPDSLAVTFARLQRGDLRREPDEIRRRWKGSRAAKRVEIALYWMCLRQWLIPLVLFDTGQMVAESWPNRAQMVAEWSMNRDQMVREWCANGQGKVGEWWPNRHRIVGFFLRNYAKYHISRDANKIPDGKFLASPPTLPTLPTLPEEELETTSLVLSHQKRAAPIALKGDWPSVEKLVSIYNEHSPDECRAVQQLSEGRIKKARRYLTQFPEQKFWEEVINQIKASLFLRGLQNTNGHKSFRADFDWLLSQGKDGSENVVKVHDGRYFS